MRADKVIEKIEANKIKVLDKEIISLKEKYEEADLNYRDTGYDRYWNTMKRCEEDLEILENYKDRDKAIKEAIEVKDKCEREVEDIKKNIKNQLIYLESTFPDCSELRSLKMYVDGL